MLYNSVSEKPCDALTSRAAPNPHSLLGGTRMSDPNDTIPYGFCHCGCGEKTRIAPRTQSSRGWSKGEPVRFAYGHHARSLVPPHVVDNTTGCWNWQRGFGDKGYGSLGHNGKVTYPHIVNYVNKFGPVPKGLELDHLCRNRRCCNPDHVEAVTRAVNVQRGALAKLTAEQVSNIRSMRGTKPYREIGELFGISTGQAGRIIRGERWKEEGSLYVRKK